MNLDKLLDSKEYQILGIEFTKNKKNLFKSVRRVLTKFDPNLSQYKKRKYSNEIYNHCLDRFNIEHCKQSLFYQSRSRRKNDGLLVEFYMRLRMRSQLIGMGLRKKSMSPKRSGNRLTSTTVTKKNQTTHPKRK